jgi:ABC-2 type transport system ATP-binding protein
MEMDGPDVLEVEGLTKIFDNRVRAVDGISFKVKKGEILGFLGPNGAGKTTTLNMLSTLLQPTSGTAKVNGYDIVEERDGVRRRIGFVFQDQTLDNELTGRENLDFHCRIYGLKPDIRRQRIKEMLEIVQLTERADDIVKTYSGGMKRRLEIARGLLHHPKVLFLDEPTLGLDPQTRHAIWEHIQRLNQEENVTIILTTHYTEEADQLCNRILIIDSGKIVALDTPDKLKGRLEGDIVGLTFRDSESVSKIKAILKEKKWVHRVVSSPDGRTQNRMKYMMMRDASDGGGEINSEIKTEEEYRGDNMQGRAKRRSPKLESKRNIQSGHSRKPKQLNLVVENGGHRIPEIVKLADGFEAILQSVELHKPTLDDVFLSVTGRKIRDEQGSFMDMVRRHRMLQTRSQRKN